MTDKERFEELAYNVGISLDGEKAMMNSDDYDFLYNYALQQSERVKELEEKLDEQVYNNKQLDKINRKWLRQNKRYREALLDVRETLNTSLSMDVESYESVEIIDKALEGEE